jgi:hypothetical protein
MKWREEGRGARFLAYYRQLYSYQIFITHYYIISIHILSHHKYNLIKAIYISFSSHTFYSYSTSSSDQISFIHES